MSSMTKRMRGKCSCWNEATRAQSSMPVEEPGPEPEPPAPKGPTLIVGSKAIISASMSMTGFGTVLS